MFVFLRTGNYKLHHLDGVRCHVIHTKFHKVNRGDHMQTHTNRKVIS
jgi:hypothetical protein